MLLREFERAGCAFPRAGRIATRSERFGPSEKTAGCPQWHVVGFVELARERQVLVGLLVLAEDLGEQAQIQPVVSVPGESVPVELVGRRLDALMEDRGDGTVAV